MRYASPAEKLTLPALGRRWLALNHESSAPVYRVCCPADSGRRLPDSTLPRNRKGHDRSAAQRQRGRAERLRYGRLGIAVVADRAHRRRAIFRLVPQRAGERDEAWTGRARADASLTRAATRSGALNSNCSTWNNVAARLTDCNHVNFHQHVARSLGYFDGGSCGRIFLPELCVALVHGVEVVHVLQEDRCLYHFVKFRAGLPQDGGD